MTLTRLEPTGVDKAQTFAFESVTVNSNLSSNNLTSNTLVISKTANLGNVGNITITGGSSNHVLVTNGSGNLSWGQPILPTANTVANNSQPNITSLGTLSELRVTTPTLVADNPVRINSAWNNSLVNFNTVDINVTDTASGATSNLINLRINTVSRFSVNKQGNITAGNASLGNLNAAFVAGTLTTAAQPNITSIGQLSTLGVTGNIVAGNTIISGSLYGALQGTIGGLTPNTGIFTNVSVNNNLVVAGNLQLSGSNSNLGNAARANFFIGDGGLLSNITASSITAVANANYSNFSNQAVFATNIVSGNQPNITNLGNITLANLTATSNITSINIAASNITATNISATNIAGKLSTASQPTITEVGTLSNLIVSGQVDTARVITTSSREKFSVVTNPGASVSRSYADGTVVYFKSIVNSFGVDFTSVPIDNNVSIVFVLILVQGATAYAPSSISINGVVQTIKWLGGGVPTSTPNKTETYSYICLRESNSWIVTGQLNTYG